MVSFLDATLARDRPSKAASIVNVSRMGGALVLEPESAGETPQQGALEPSLLDLPSCFLPLKKSISRSRAVLAFCGSGKLRVFLFHVHLSELC